MNSFPYIVGVGGLTSDVGKTTLVCDLLQAFPGWEAIKTTRGHYRSCGKDPHACCVSGMLEEKAVVRSERALTDVPGKDTGRYWSAGATNVNWVIATDEQVDQGVREALHRVRAPGVFVEGNSFALTIKPDFFIMVARPDRDIVKTSARRALEITSAALLSGEAEMKDKDRLTRLFARAGLERPVPIFLGVEFNELCDEIQRCISLIQSTNTQRLAS
jgi:molybdopterin-guanine dinucleotide biosynthesis protein